MIIEELAVGPIAANCFILGCEKTREAVVIDPGDEADRILLKLARHKLTVKSIIDTHGHFDHVGANREMKEATGAELLIHEADAPMLGFLSQMAASFGMRMENSPPPDRTIAEGDEIPFGTLSVKVLETPGHSPGSISLLADQAVFVGDTLFAGSIGRTDFPGGSYPQLIAAVRAKLFTLDEALRVYPGHGPATTIGHEKRTNPFFR